MRFEDQFGIMEKDSAEREAFLDECARLREDIENAVGSEAALYNDIINLVLKVSDHILIKEPQVRKGVRNIMGGKVLTLSSEKLLKKGRMEGRMEGRAKEREENIQKIAENYLANGLADSMEEALDKAKALLS